MAEIGISVAAKVAEYLVDPLRRQLSYLFNYQSNVEDLRIQLENLGDVKVRVDRDVAVARRNGDEIEPDVDKWLNSANGITEEAGKFFEDEDKAKKRCFNGLCPNFSRYQLNKKAKKTTQEVVKIKGEGKFDRVSYPAPTQGIRSTFVKGYQTFESRISTLKEIMESLRNPTINMIGVCGMGGVGKTMLVKEVARKAKEYKLFDEVVMAEVSETPDLEKIRGTIADMLGLKFDQVSEFGRADRLRERLKKEKILVILDDIWGRLNLEAVGIPFGDDPLKMAGESERKGCKILLTSRSEEVLSNQMDTQKNFGIGVLLENEAWNLFKKMAGDSVEDPDLQPTAMEVAKKCARLPIAIVTVAKALKNKSLFVWKDALQQLQRSNPRNITGMHEDVYSSLELSYNHLKSEEKSLFLLCGLIAVNQIYIKDLLKYGMGLGLFQDINTLEEARNRLHTLVHNLKASCLLLDSDVGWVKIHDVVRDVAISIASRDQNGFMVRYGVWLKEWPKKDILKNCHAISFLGSNIHEFPDWLECPELKQFYLSISDPALKIPDTFFKEMKELKVLDLTEIHISSLPSSLHFLANLQTLCLDYCMLGDIAVIGELKNLQILSFMGSDIVQLPREIGQLTHLRLLDLRDCSQLKVIPPNVISSLSRLEDLCMKNSFVQWEVDGLNNQRCNASLVELKNLSCLIDLELHIPNAKILPKGLLFENLIRYRILVGDAWDWSCDNESSRTLKLKLNTSIHLEDGAKMLLKRTEDLYLDGSMGIRNLHYDIDREGFQRLKHLHVQSNPEIQYIISSMEWVPCSAAFPILESLFLNNLTTLEEIICHGQLPVESFCKLRVIKVECCDKLKNLFSLSLARGLLKVREMEINDCKIMDGIVAEGREDEEAVDKIMFPQLSRLTLQRLPELMSFCSKVKTMPSIPFRRQKLLTTNAGSEEIILAGEHDIPIPLFNKKVAFHSLEFLKLSELYKLKQIWHDQLLVESCINLRRLVVEKCAFLLNVVSSNVLQSLQNLEEFTVQSCKSVEQVFDLEGLTYDEEHAGLLSHLVELNLTELPRLRCIWNRDPQGILSFQNLKWVHIEKCNHLRNLFSPSMALDLVQLETLNITNCDMMEEIVEKEKGAKEEAIDKIVFPLLSYTTLVDLPNLTSFYPGNHTFECPSLKLMGIIDCPKIKTFTSTHEGLQETSGKGDLDIPRAPLFNEKVAFPSLELLKLSELSKLKQIWHGQLPVESCTNLRRLVVEKCAFLLNVVSSNVLQSLQNLEEFTVQSCDSVEQVFDLEGLTCDEEHARLLPHLVGLKLIELPRLRCIWNRHPQGILSFQNLRGLHIEKCNSLRNLFSPSMALELMQLETLNIINCDVMEEIVKKEKGAKEEAIDKIVFLLLRTITLVDLPNLRSFYPGNHTFECPSLKLMTIDGCPELKAFTASTNEGLQDIPSAPLFNKKVAFPNLEVLVIRSNGSLRYIFDLGGLNNNFVQLQELAIILCPLMKEIVEEEGVEEETTYKIVLPQVTSLKLFNLQKLKSFCQGIHISEWSSLKILEVYDCEDVEIFASELISFEETRGKGHLGPPTKQPLFLVDKIAFPNLEELELGLLSNIKEIWQGQFHAQSFCKLRVLKMWQCDEILKVFPISFLRNLQNLEKLSIKYCSSLEIIANEEGEATDETTFSQLTSLKLKNLPNLTSFFQGSNTFSFPSLQKVLVEECPKLKTFSNGILSTPKLEKVQVQEDEWIWEGDLNTTIQHLFTQK